MISRYWNREPDWFDNLDRDLQLRLLADYQLSNEAPEDRKKKRIIVQRGEIQSSYPEDEE